ncbi:MAG: hypothetical protein COV69_00230 [Parcubacteria group bacterium CG11_big_fil_rev_8_21_14_0_20_39_14]|nr:MAG: hypothetical protein COV69_00230 [Parcubacteria group bacterium CG11_big_fil_rev_8_21_14_0_20_39_14]PIS35797.1 MAG: hypothetical protein COT36_00515 [Parcubacteria group bacterium CG08_land_8_20_14_0_20_38_56]
MNSVDEKVVQVQGLIQRKRELRERLNELSENIKELLSEPEVRGTYRRLSVKELITFAVNGQHFGDLAVTLGRGRRIRQVEMITPEAARELKELIKNRQEGEILPYPLAYKKQWYSPPVGLFQNSSLNRALWAETWKLYRRAEEAREKEKEDKELN